VEILKLWWRLPGDLGSEGSPSRIFQDIVRTFSGFDPEKPTKLDFADAGSNAVALVDGRHDDVSVAVPLPRHTNDGPDDLIHLVVPGNRLKLDFRKKWQDVARAAVDDFAILAARIAVDAGHAETCDAELQERVSDFIHRTDADVGSDCKHGQDSNAAMGKKSIKIGIVDPPWATGEGFVME